LALENVPPQKKRAIKKIPDGPLKRKAMGDHPWPSLDHISGSKPMGVLAKVKKIKEAKHPGIVWIHCLTSRFI
jgi:hypothetical protein